MSMIKTLTREGERSAILLSGGSFLGSLKFFVGFLICISSFLI